jgi:AcrR family transcriptional regulator
MSDTTPRRRGPRPSLTRHQVVDAALDLIDEEGINALNLRKLAARLGISAMTPYSYFDDKADLLNAAVDRGLDPLSAARDPEDDWESQLRAFFFAMHRTLEEHPGLLELAMLTNGTPSLEENRRVLVDTLIAEGLSERRAGDTLRALTAYVLGYGALRRMRRDAPSQRHTDDPFEHGLEAILDAARRDVERADVRRS